MRKVLYISLRQLPPRLVRVLLVYIYIYIYHIPNYISKCSQSKTYLKPPKKHLKNSCPQIPMPPGVPGVPPQWWATPPMTDPKMLLPQPCLAEDAGRDCSVNPRNNSFLVNDEYQKWPCSGNNSVWVGQSYPGWWYTYPSEKYDFASWDDDIPNMMGKS